jgi:phosphate acetyltransferase
MSEGKIASIGVDSPEPAASASKYDRLISEARRSAAAKAIVVHPCDETSLRGAVEAAAIGLISATLVGPAAKINNVAREHSLDIGKCELVDVAHSDAAASKAVELIRAGQGELLMKGSLHTDELMRPATASATGLRTERRISHVFIMDVPTYPETLFITDAAINIFPDLDAKRDIVQNAIDLFTQIGLGKPRVAILSAVETVTTKIPSTIEAAALCSFFLSARRWRPNRLLSARLLRRYCRSRLAADRSQKKPWPSRSLSERYCTREHLVELSNLARCS